MENNFDDIDGDFPYKDILELPHHVSATHPHMSMTDRGAQFSPFAALTGYDAAVKETARYTESRLEPDDEEKAELNRRLNIIKRSISQNPYVKITYFKPDEKKDGGEYQVKEGNVKRLDEYKRVIVMTDKTSVKIDDIYKIEGDIIDFENKK